MSRPPSPPPWPAPTMVWISSMNRIRLSFSSVISLRIFWTRSSNSPRYFDPATIELMLSSTSRLSRSASGTSPATIRCASPSTMAVLPTPGSPISTGLFFFRRASTSIVVSISRARPMTGSSLPSRASFVRSRLNWSRSGVLEDASTRPSSAPLPTTLVTCWRSACGVNPYLRRIDAARPSPSSARPMRRCSGPT
ncbi:hypothetical protein D3C73_955960 [compost metagenome]